jgi:hypothetical protein
MSPGACSSFSSRQLLAWCTDSTFCGSNRAFQKLFIVLPCSNPCCPCSWLLQVSAAVAPAGDAAAAPQWGVSATTTRRTAAA